MDCASFSLVDPSGETGVPGVRHVGPKEFGPVVERAMQLPGFGPEQQDKADGPKHLVGFGRETMLGAAPEVRLLTHDDGHGGTLMMAVVVVMIMTTMPSRFIA